MLEEVAARRWCKFGTYVQTQSYCEILLFSPCLPCLFRPTRVAIMILLHQSIHMLKTSYVEPKIVRRTDAYIKHAIEWRVAWFDKLKT